MTKLQLTFLFLIIGIAKICSQVSKVNDTAGTLVNGPGHIDRTFVFASGEFGTCTALDEVDLTLQLAIGTGTPCSGGAYGVHEDLNVRLVSPMGTTVDLVQDRWGYWTGDPTQPHSFNGFTVVDATIGFDDDNIPNISTLNDWTAGNYAPHNSLSAFDGENPVGTWTLRISDGNSQFSTNDYYCYVRGTLTVSCGGLPIELTKFTLQKTIDNDVQINWQTASELNNDFFTIQRSENTTDWENVVEVSGQGNSIETKEYSIIDNQPYSGISYYRIKQTDFDGNFEYSEIKSIEISNYSLSTIEIYPNPTNSIVHVIGNESLAKEELRIYNIYGQELTTNLKIEKSNKDSFRIDFTNLKSGIYFLKTKTTIKRVYVIRVP